MRAPTIGVFDSGVGGLSIFAAVRARLPGANFAYCTDSGNFPYGTKTEAEVVACTYKATRRFIERARLDLLVVACNTASTVALPHLRAQFQVAVVGVVPAIKPAAELSVTGTIGLLATPGTVQRPYTSELIATYATGLRVGLLGTSLLVDMAERKLRGEGVDLEALRREIRPLFDQSPTANTERLDTVVLGCTHFPLLGAELAAVAPWSVRWLDSSEAVALRTASLVHEQGGGGASHHQASGTPRFYCTRNDPSVAELTPALVGLGFAPPEEL